MFIPYLPIANIESRSKNKDSFKKKKSGEVLNKGIDQISKLLKDFKKKSNKKLNKKLNKKSNYYNSSKDFSKKT